MRRLALLALLMSAPAAAQTLTGDHFKQAPPTPPPERPVRPAKAEPRPTVTSVESPGATLRGLDKMTGKTTTFELKAGQSRDYERLTVTLQACRHPGPGEGKDAFAFLSIRDKRQPAPVFQGWMFASSPALSALDHPRYDVWVLSCSTSSSDASTGSAQN